MWDQAESRWVSYIWVHIECYGQKSCPKWEQCGGFPAAIQYPIFESTLSVIQWLKDTFELRILLFEKSPHHPSCFIQMIVKPTCIWALLAKAAWLLGLSNEEKTSFLCAICIAGKAKCKTKLVCMFSTHFLLWESTIRWSKCKESWFVNIPAVFQLKSGQEFPDTGLFLFHSFNLDWSCFSMSSNLLELMPTQMWATIRPTWSSLTHDRRIESTLVQ